MKAIKVSMPAGGRRLKSLLLGAVCGALSSAGLTALCALCLSKMGTLPRESLWIIVIVMLAIGGFTGGYISARSFKANGLLMGAGVGLLLFIILAAGKACTTDSGLSTHFIYKACALIGGGALGGIIGVNKKERIKIK